MDSLENTNYLQELTKLLVLIALIIPFSANGQENRKAYTYPTFENQQLIQLIKSGTHHIYNQQPDSAARIIQQVKAQLPNHPAPILMEALIISWQHMPLTPHMEEFAPHQELLFKTIAASEKLLEKDDNHVEGIFYQMVARGLLAEYYAGSGNYIKALGQAKKTYNFMKMGFDLVDEYPEFLFTTGLYNYFREKYPEKHPLYKPLLWFFKGGDIALGLSQLKRATTQAVLSSVEAHLYLSYIYLRYENKPEKAVKHLETLNRSYPKNAYFKAKLVESYMLQESYLRAEAGIETLLDHEVPYYRLVGESFKGMWLEKYVKAYTPAADFYNKALDTANKTNRGGYYHSQALLGLGRLDMRNGHFQAARTNIEKALQISDATAIQQEGRQLLKDIP